MGASGSLAKAAAGIAASEFEIARDGDVVLSEDGEELRRWSFAVEPDAPPTIDLVEPVDRTLSGEIQIEYAAADDHGVTGARAVIALDLASVDRRYGLATDPEPRETIAVDLPLPMTGAATEIAETLVEDFSEHPWVGLPVTVTLIATDAMDQEGRRDDIAAILPGRRFYNPMAAGLVEMRRDLLWSVENGRRVTQVLKAMTHRPDDAFDAPGDLDRAHGDPPSRYRRPIGHDS